MGGIVGDRRIPSGRGAGICLIVTPRSANQHLSAVTTEYKTDKYPSELTRRRSAAIMDVDLANKTLSTTVEALDLLETRRPLNLCKNSVHRATTDKNAIL